MRRIVTSALIAVLLATVTGAGASKAGPGAPLPIRLILQWAHQAQFAGYYVALDKGFYSARGLDVSLLPGGPGRAPAALLGEGEAEAGTIWLTDALVARDHGVPLVQLAQIVNRSNLMLVAWKNKGIGGLGDLEGRRVSLWGSPLDAPFDGLFRARGLHVQRVPQYDSVNLFLRGGVDACSGMSYNEANRIYEAGVDSGEVTAFALRDLGFGFPEDGLYCLEPYFKAHRQECEALAAATMEGWREAARDPEGALRLVMRYARSSHVPANEAHMRWMLATILPSILPAPGDPWTFGHLSGDDYARAVDLLKGQGLIHHAEPPSVFRPSEASDAP